MKMIATNNENHKILKYISVKTGKTMMDLLVEAIEFLKEKYKDDNN